MSRRKQLEEPYRRTSYVANGPDGLLTLRIGERSIELESILARHQAVSWAFLTAHNPSSVRVSDQENQARQERLETDLAARGDCCYPGAGMADETDWPPEASVLVIGIDEADAVELARRHGQAAIVAGSRGEPARLVWCIDD